VIIMAWVTVLLFIVMAIVLAFSVKTKEDNEEDNASDDEERHDEPPDRTTFDEYLEAQHRLDAAVARHEETRDARANTEFMRTRPIPMDTTRPLYPTHVLLTAHFDNPYLAHWGPLVDAWKKVANVRAVLLLVGDPRFVPIDLPHRNQIVLMPPVPHVPSRFTAACMSLLYPALMLNATVTVCNLNVLLLKAAYLHDNLRPHHEGDFVRFLRPFQAHQSPFLSTAHHTTWARIFRLRSMVEARERVVQWYERSEDEKNEADLATARELHTALTEWAGDDEGDLHTARGFHFNAMAHEGICTTPEVQWDSFSHTYLPRAGVCDERVHQLFQYVQRQH